MIIKPASNPDQIKEYLENGIFDYFKIYELKKDQIDFYECHASYAQELIKTYYYLVDKPKFDLICKKFIESYILSESEVENVVDPRERAGLATVYENTILKFVPDNLLNIHMLLLIRQILYSKCPNPEAGGIYRSEEDGAEVRLSNFNVKLAPCKDVVPLINGLYPESVELFERGKKLGLEKDPGAIIDYIGDCVRFNCKIIKIHPFIDGNKRTSRALMNLMFKTANIPPVFVTPQENPPYRRALEKALKDEDYDDIICFYYYKILESIWQLDIMPKINANKTR